MLVAGLSNGYLVFFETTSKKVLHSFKAHVRAIHALQCNSKILVSASYDGMLRFWTCHGLHNFFSKKFATIEHVLVHKNIVMINWHNHDQTLFTLTFLDANTGRHLYAMESDIELHAIAMNEEYFFVMVGRVRIDQYSKQTMARVGCFVHDDCIHGTSMLCYKDRFLISASTYNVVNLQTKTYEELGVPFSLKILDTMNEQDEIFFAQGDKISQYDPDTNTSTTIVSDKFDNAHVVYATSDSLFIDAPDNAIWQFDIATKSKQTYQLPILPPATVRSMVHATTIRLPFFQFQNVLFSNATCHKFTDTTFL